MKHSFIDEHSGINSFLSNINPQIKVITFLVFIIFINLTKRNYLTSLLLYGFVLFILILLSKIPINFIFKRSLIFSPFILITTALLPFSLWRIIIVKAYLSTICVILLTSSTKFPQLLKAIEFLKCPKLITNIISFMYRYIFLIEDELMKMQQARDARLIKKSNLLNLKTNTSILGTLFIKSYERAESVYLAMQARGFSGEINILNSFCLQRKDLIFMLAVISLLVGIKFFI